jgi:hypothetical protein
MQVTECFGNLLFSIRTPFAVDSALLEEFSFPQPAFIVAAHIICRCARETERVAPRACTVLPRAHARAPLRAHSRAPLRAHARAPLSAHALNAAAVRMCRFVPCGPCMRRKVRDRTCLGWERELNPNSPVGPVPPLPPTPLPPPSSGRVGWRKEMQLPGNPGGLLDWRILRPMDWPAHVGPRLPARSAAAAGTAGPRRLLARQARGCCSKMDPKMAEQ